MESTFELKNKNNLRKVRLRMKESFAKKHPVILSLAYVVLVSLFASIATIIATTLKMSQIQTMLIQTGGFLLSAMLAFVIMVKSKYPLQEYGFRFSHDKDIYGILWFVPLLLVEGITFIAGIDRGITPTYIIVVFLLMIVVSVNEEVYFRGLIIKTLSVKGNSFAIIISSALFGLAHLGTLSVGKGIAHTLGLVAYSALIAFVFAEIVVTTRSIFIPIIWHFTHNFISSITAETSYGMTLIIVGIKCVILLSYAIYLWIGIKRREQMFSDNTNISS